MLSATTKLVKPSDQKPSELETQIAQVITIIKNKYLIFTYWY
jgi:hypothetical protein